MLFRYLSVIFFVTNLTVSAADVPPKLKREFRAAWVPSVGNIQWPSKKGLSTQEQKAELISILDRAQLINLNAIILQVRPACDALYASQFEPWSEYLTGQMGKAPSPYYDPLEFAVAESHKRGLELHAWINPFRARFINSTSSTSPNHVTKKYSGMAVSYGKHLWLDPGQKAVHDYSIAVVTDIVRRYDIDGLHMDDYFYPYAERDEAKKVIPFPDDPSWKKYQRGGGKLSRSDWRRQNVDAFVARTHQTVKAAKPWVKFGVSPFGIWKPGHPASTSLKSGNMFEELYCDSLKWWTNGWVDYLAPQLYWPIEPPDQSFTALLKWWSDANVKRRHLWPGMNTAKTADKWKAVEIANQIKATRAQPGVSGHIHWSMKGVMRNSGGVTDALKPLYQEPALVPASPWLNNFTPLKPTLSMTKGDGNHKIQWSAGHEKPAFWVLQQQYGTEWKTAVVGGQQAAFNWNKKDVKPVRVAVSSINRYGTQSPPALLTLK